MATEIMQENPKPQHPKDRRFHGISRVKKATKSVAKTLNHILTKAKSKLTTGTTAAATCKQTNAALNEIFGLEQSFDHNDIGIIRSERVDDDIDMIENERRADNHNGANDSPLKEVDLNKTSTSSLHFIESSPFAVDECEWHVTEDGGSFIDRDSGIGSSFEDCSSSIQSSPLLDQITWNKPSNGSLEECMSSDSLSLVSLIINRSQSRSPIVFRPDFYVKEKTTATSASPNGHGHHHHHQRRQHTLYRVSNDNHSTIDDYASVIERINAKKLAIASNGIVSTHLKTGKNTTKSKKIKIKIKIAFPSKYTKKLSSIISSANIMDVAQKFLSYVSIVQ